MRLIEIIVAGVPGTQGALKYDLLPGLNVWKPKGTFRLEALTDLLLSLFYPTTGQSVPLGPGKAQRAGVIFEARGTTYRLVRDFVAKKSTLGSLEAGSQDRFQELSKESRFILETLTRAVRLPSNRAFRELFIATPGSTSTAVTAKQVKGWDESVQGEAASGSGDAAKRLEALKRERNQLKQIAELEFKHDGLQARVFQIDDQLRKLDEPRQLAEKARQEVALYAKFDAPGVVTPQVLAKLKAYPQAGERKEKELQDVANRALDWQSELSTIPDREYWKEPLAIGGLAFAIAMIITATVVGSRGWLLWLFLGLMTAGFGVGVYGILMGLKRMERLVTLKKKVSDVEVEKAGIEKRFEIESNMVRQFFDSVGMQDVEEIHDALARRDEAKKDLQVAQDQLKQVELEVPEASLQTERSGLLEQMEAIQKTLQDLPPASVDPNELERQIRELEMMVRTGGAVESSGPVEGDDELSSLLRLSGEVLQRTGVEVLSRIRQGLIANLSAMSEGRIKNIEISAGRITGFVDAEGTLLPWAKIAGDARARLLFALQFTLWQLLASEPGQFFLLDLSRQAPSSPLGGLCLSAATHLAKKAQVLVLTPPTS